jgi:SecD/SecF fusion protein
VLTRSLATSFTTLLAVASLFVFGGATLQDFAFAMFVGIASGTYSSIFIASPVLTAWKEREPGFARRRERIAALDGSVPAFAEDAELSKLADDSETEADVAVRAAEAEPEPERPAGAVATVEREQSPSPSSNGEAAAAEKASAERRERNAERREKRQRRRKHGRNR